jgi:RimJ/RimL family protein N-acetyltransferase
MLAGASTLMTVQTFTHTLRDGTALSVRPLRPSDRHLIAAGFDSLSDESRYRRFMAPTPRLTERQLDYFTMLDQVDHFAWAVLGPLPEERPVATARYVRLEQAPDVAELAVTVVDEFQGRGVGTLLVPATALAAVCNGIDVLRAHLLTDNHRMLTVLERLGGTITEAEGPTLVVDLVTSATSERLSDDERQVLIRLIEAAPLAA